MSSKFFTNINGNTLFEKLKGIASEMANINSFHAVVGFFRSSGYFRLRKELENVNKIQILVGINIDNIFRRHNRANLFFGSEEEAKKQYFADFIDDVQNSHYSLEVEWSILQLAKDLQSGKVEMRIHPSKNLHAKFYLCLPENHTEHSDGWVIMGSSNISESGLGLLQPPHYELNVAMKDYDSVKFCKDEFDKLWAESIEITDKDINENRNQTYLRQKVPTPYELYMKVLIDTFGSSVEDNFTMQLPDGFMDLKYQKDAVIQGYQMLLQHGGFFLADVVGLGKTLVAAMIAKRFIESNGSTSSVLVIYPPAVEKNWKETFKKFQINSYTQFVSNGSLHKILDRENNLDRDIYYKDKSEYDLVIVDEAHNFRNWYTERYSQLYKICKSSRTNSGLLNDSRSKKVILVSATPLNNAPKDILNQILLFQNNRRSTVEGIDSISEFFTPLTARYKECLKLTDVKQYTEETDAIYKEIRTRLIDKITVRRTRNNIINDSIYKEDLKKQGIVFPVVEAPCNLTYSMNSSLRNLFYKTLVTFTDETKGLKYARYRALEFLEDKEKRNRYRNTILIGENLKGIYRIRMVKRLESSFYALKRSLATFLNITESLIRQYEKDKIIIAKGLNITSLEAKGWELDRILEYAENHGFDKDEIIFKKSDFSKEFINILKEDRKKLKKLNQEWSKVNDDPKLDMFIKELPTMLDKRTNPSQKLVVFTESVDTLNYLYEQLRKRLKRKDIIGIWSENRDREKETVKNNFDAICTKDKRSMEYNIILATDVLAEGINLHRANVIVNYDTPWNAKKLMQRIGRVNRIGSSAEKIINYMFYPSRQGDEEINLYRTSLIKLQGFHSAFGEDQKIYTEEELLREFELFNSNISDVEDKRIALLREARELYNSDIDMYRKIKSIPDKSRCIRKSKSENESENSSDKNFSIAFIKSKRKAEYYKITHDNISVLDFTDAVDYIRANKNEKPVSTANMSLHYEHVNRAVEKFKYESIKQSDDRSISSFLSRDRQTMSAVNFLKNIKTISENGFREKCDALILSIEEGNAPLRKEITVLQRNFENDVSKNKLAIIERIESMYNDNCFYSDSDIDFVDISEPKIVVSETFV